MAHKNILKEKNIYIIAIVFAKTNILAREIIVKEKKS